MKKLKSLLLLVLLAAFVLVLADCASRTAYVQKPPPAVKKEVRGPKPYTNAVWIGGNWKWQGGQYVWVSGYWTKPVAGKKWVPGHWKKTARGHVWVKGHWRR